MKNNSNCLPKLCLLAIIGVLGFAFSQEWLPNILDYAIRKMRFPTNRNGEIGNLAEMPMFGGVFPETHGVSFHYDLYPTAYYASISGMVTRSFVKTLASDMNLFDCSGQLDDIVEKSLDNSAACMNRIPTIYYKGPASRGCLAFVRLLYFGMTQSNPTNTEEGVLYIKVEL